MSFRETQQSEQYKRVLKALEAEGFVNANEIPQGSNTTLQKTIIRQNNSILQYLADICQKQKDLEAKVEFILQTLRSEKLNEPEDISKSLEQLQTQLKNLSLGKKKEVYRAPPGKIFVYENPLKIYKEELEKSKYPKNEYKFKDDH